MTISIENRRRRAIAEFFAKENRAARTSEIRKTFSLSEWEATHALGCPTFERIKRGIYRLAGTDHPPTSVEQNFERRSVGGKGEDDLECIRVNGKKTGDRVYSYLAQAGPMTCESIVRNSGRPYNEVFCVLNTDGRFGRRRNGLWMIKPEC
ncbi:MAG: hypothetical protein KDA60_16025 [Planctomycetales bacterium]|nr:hypothetical protein [Planctomycetales bacterium]